MFIICFNLAAFLTQGGLWDLAPCPTRQSWSYTTGMTHSLCPCMLAAYTCANTETAAAVVLLLPSHSARTAAVEDISLPTALYIGLFIVILTRPIYLWTSVASSFYSKLIKSGASQKQRLQQKSIQALQLVYACCLQASLMKHSKTDPTEQCSSNGTKAT